MTRFNSNARGITGLSSVAAVSSNDTFGFQFDDARGGRGRRRRWRGDRTRGGRKVLRGWDSELVLVIILTNFSIRRHGLNVNDRAEFC